MKKISALVLLSFTVLFFSCGKDDSLNSPVTGTGGSLARFTIKDNFLYTVSPTHLHSFNISQPENILFANKQEMGFGIETIFPSGDHLFMGAENGMYIYELTDPAKPRKISFTPHFVSKDPVVVQGDYAYVTLRMDEWSWSGRNQLMIFDISSLENPVLKAEYNMNGPRGLAIDGDKLFICDDVLKVFQVINGYEITLLKTFNIPAIDVIPEDGFLYVVAEDGLYQYSYNDNEITLLSKITLKQ